MTKQDAEFEAPQLYRMEALFDETYKFRYQIKPDIARLWRFQQVGMVNLAPLFCFASKKENRNRMNRGIIDRFNAQ